MYDHIFKFIDKEISDLNNRIVSNGKLNMQEIQYVDLLSHIKKSMLTVDAMEHPENYNWEDGYGVRGKITSTKREENPLISELYNLVNKAPDELSKRKIEEFVSEMDRMI